MNSSEATQQAPETQYPMFYKQPVPIGQERHAKAGLMPITHCKFATETNSISLNTSEFIEAAKFYPIVFTQDNPTPVAVVGLETSNYFVNEDGLWAADTYIPAYIRRYPFIFMQLPDQNELLLCIDEECEQYNKDAPKEASRLYVDGKASELTNAALEFAKIFQQHQELTQQFVKELQDADLLMLNSSNITLASGRKVTLNGFQMIDEEKFQALPDEKILEFHKKGWLPFIYFVLMSTSNWQRLSNIGSMLEGESND